MNVVDFSNKFYNDIPAQDNPVENGQDVVLITRDSFRELPFGGYRVKCYKSGDVHKVAIFAWLSDAKEYAEFIAEKHE